MAGPQLTVHIHIGAGKVGSTTIQHAAAAHRAELAAAGVLYPAGPAWRRNHAALAHELRGREPSGSLDRLGEALAHHDGDVLLSSEFFNAVPVEGLQALRQVLAGRPVSVVMYLRPYTEWLRSAYMQQALPGRFLEDFDAFFASRKVRFADRIERWASVFGWSTLRVRTLDEVGGDVLADLSATIGVRLLARRPANVTPAWTAVETARWLAGRGEPAPRLATAAARVDAAHRELGLPRHADYLTGDQRRALTDGWRRDLQRISAGTGHPFPAVPADERSRPWLPTFDRLPEPLRAVATEELTGG